MTFAAACAATPVPSGVFVDLLRMVTERQSVLDALAVRLPEAAGGYGLRGGVCV